MCAQKFNSPTSSQRLCRNRFYRTRDGPGFLYKSLGSHVGSSYKIVITYRMSGTGVCPVLYPS